MLALFFARTEPTQMQEMAEALRGMGRGLNESLSAGPAGAVLDYELGGVLIVELILAAGIVLAGLFVRWLLLWLAGRLERRWFAPTRPGQEGPLLFAMRLLGVLLLLFALFLACMVITLPRSPLDWDVALWRVYLSIALVWAALLVGAIVEFGADMLTHRRSGELRLGNRQVMPLLRDITKVGVLVIALVLVVQTWGYNATALLAGVGIGGLAIAFAAQDTIANLFGTMVIYSDHPYKVGDHVIIAGIEGLVEEIGVRSTRIRLFDRTIASVPNKSVAHENVFNLTLMNHRRVRFRVSLSYDVTPGQIEAALDALRVTLATQSGTVPNQYWAYLYQFAEYSQDILVQCFTESAEYEDYLEVQSELLLRVRRKLDELGLKQAYPTQIVHYAGRHAELDGSAGPGLPGDKPSRGN